MSFMHPFFIPAYFFSGTVAVNGFGGVGGCTFARLTASHRANTENLQSLDYSFRMDTDSFFEKKFIFIENMLNRFVIGNAENGCHHFCFKDYLCKHWKHWWAAWKELGEE
ncbi:hypothetical protein AMECASPLE_030512 [Ameca splendens]|uniref:Uncharacterized protein n=1 Tax=Ameca splendens TaxID=208324 RepID=A0ABV1ACD1_9TELE